MKDGGPAFPVMLPHAQDDRGMSLRDWFAGLALMGEISDGGWQSDQSGVLAELCFMRADAMLAERARKLETGEK